MRDHHKIKYNNIFVLSYDDDIQKNAIANMKADIDLGLGPPQMPRR